MWGLFGVLQEGTYCAQEQWKIRQREVLTEQPKKALGRTACTLWSHLSCGRTGALLNCWFGIGFTLTGMILCLPSCSALLWPWTETVKSPKEGQSWNCTQHRYSPGPWSGSNAQPQRMGPRGLHLAGRRNLRAPAWGDGNWTSHYHLRWMQNQEGKHTLSWLHPRSGWRTSQIHCWLWLVCIVGSNTVILCSVRDPRALCK